MKAITENNFTNNVTKHLEEVSDSSQIILVSRESNEKDAVVLISLAEYNSLNETNYLKSSHKNHDRLMESIEQYRKGETIEIDLDNIID